MARQSHEQIDVMLKRVLRHLSGLDLKALHFILWKRPEKDLVLCGGARRTLDGGCNRS